MGLSINSSWSFVSSLLWVKVSFIDTYFYQRRKLNPYNKINFFYPRQDSSKAGQMLAYANKNGKKLITRKNEDEPFK